MADLESKKIKVLHITDTLGSGGKERQLIEVLKFFSKNKKVKSELIVMSDIIHYTDIFSLNIIFYIVKRNYKKDISIFFSFYKLFKKIKPDIIHSWHSMCTIYALPAAKLLGIKLVNNLIQDAPLKIKHCDQRYIRSKITFPFSTVIAANSYAGLKAYNLSAKNSVCLHNGFDFERIKNLQEKEYIKKFFSIETKYVVGMVATFSEKKDYETFITTAKSIIKERDDVTFIAIGDGIYYDKFYNSIADTDRNRIKLLGRQKRILNIVNVFDVGVLTTFTEGISNSIMEYMALKKPVIVTYCDGNRELVSNNITGFLISVSSHSQLKDKITYLLDNESIRFFLGNNGYRKLKQNYSLDKMGQNFLSLYDTI